MLCSDSSQSVLKSEQADMLVAAVDKFAQQIPLNLEANQRQGGRIYSSAQSAGLAGRK